MSIKWKISFAFILLTFGIVGLYIAIAKQTFESDKISYIFDTQQREVSQISADLNEKVSRMLFDARAILSGYNATTQTLSTDADSLFKNHPQIEAIDVRNASTLQVVTAIQKTPEAAEPLTRLAAVATEPGKLNLVALDKDQFMASLTQGTGPNSAIIRVVFRLKNLFSDASENQTVMLVSNDQVKISSNPEALPKSALEEFLKNRPSKDIASTMSDKLDGKEYLISSSPLKVGNFHVLAFMSQRSALAALNILFQRSLVFLAMSFFATVIISLFLSNSLTKNINLLKIAAEKIGEGDFNAAPDFESKDEVGVLAAAFKRMGAEISKLVLATADKARMEAELKTAALVQESLFPAKSQFISGSFKIGGVYVTSTECGGDWWYYFEQGDFLYAIVADATGHGTPAALITSAARAMFSYIQTKELTLTEIASLCDNAIRQCSSGRVYMTAFILKINKQSGEVNYINACHEPPYLWSSEDGSDDRSGEYVTSEPDTMFGEIKHNWHERSFVMKPGEKLIVYTDGVTAVENPEQRSVPERKVRKFFDAAMKSGDEPEEASRSINNALAEYAAGTPLPDDITLVIIERLHIAMEDGQTVDEDKEADFASSETVVGIAVASSPLNPSAAASIVCPVVTAAPRLEVEEQFLTAFEDDDMNESYGVA